MSIINNGYELIDSIKANVPDCFVFNTNKIGSGSGEARIYIGSEKARDWQLFFEDFNIPCFFTKDDFERYLDMASVEYEEPTQHYRNNITENFPKIKSQINALQNDNFFKVFRKMGINEVNNKHLKHRYYIQSESDVWTIFRKTALPIMTSLLIQKIKIGDSFCLWFRPYINEIGNVFENEIIRDFVEKEVEKVQKDSTITETEKLQLTKARIGQGTFRDNTLSKYDGKCIITQVNDERILIASHIKPWILSNNSEKLSKENGLLLTPTYDKLFDKGFISFKDTGEIILSDYFGENNFKILNLSAKTKYNLKISDEMKIYLEYHRESVFIK